MTRTWTGPKPTLRADGRRIRVDLGDFTFTPAEARETARELMAAVSDAERLPGIHERHVDLTRSCAMCVFEAGPSHQWGTVDGQEVECADCGDWFNSPAGEDPANTLCAACADERDQS